MRPRRPAVFIDKDGTLVENVAHNVDPALLRFTPGAVEGLQLLQQRGYALVVVTNQPGIALGLFDRAALARLEGALVALLRRDGIVLDGFYACPHAPGSTPLAAGCPCRKPAPGLLRQAAVALALDLDRSWMVGDILDDVEAGARAGCRTILLDVGNETVWRRSPLRTPTSVQHDLLAAARHIVGCDADTTRPAGAAADAQGAASGPPQGGTPVAEGGGRVVERGTQLADRGEDGIDARQFASGTAFGAHLREVFQFRRVPARGANALPPPLRPPIEPARPAGTR